MTKLRNIKINGLWGRPEFTIHVSDEVDFLIGVNGTGKTTVMNLVGAALTGDYELLSSIDFVSLTLQFQEGRTRPRVEVKKDADPDTPGDQLAYKVYPTASAEPLLFSVATSTSFAYSLGGSPYEDRQMLFRDTVQLRREVRRLIRVVWLTVHRGHIAGPRRRTDEHIPLIDRKLHEVADGLSRYFSRLENRALKQNEQFQKSVLLSTIKDTRKSAFAAIDDETLKRMQQTAKRVFAESGINEGDYLDTLSGMFDRYQSERRNLEQKDRLLLQGLQRLMAMQRLENILVDWEEREKRRAELFIRRDRFIELLNELYRGKNVQVSQANELEVVTSREKAPLPLSMLSSGEKQLLILFGEALLQGEEGTWLYLADEPELSLHIEWQSLLVEGIRSLNPNAQIFFATHSPDVVGSYAESVHDMESIINDLEAK